jgi:hypothetical protein
MCLRRAPEKYIAGAALDRAGLDSFCICLLMQCEECSARRATVSYSWCSISV